MKKLLSVIAVLLLASALMPVQSFAGARGSITPITQGSDLTDGAHNQAALRPFPAQGGGDKLEYWMALSTRFTAEGFQTVRSIYQFMNTQQAPFFFFVPDPFSANDVRLPLRIDPSMIVSYTDPAWSPDGKFLAYAKTDKFVSSSALFMQEFTVCAAGEFSGAACATPVGAEIAISDGHGGDGFQNRHPHWSPDGNSVCFDSDRMGTSDIWTQVVRPSVGSPVRVTSDDAHTEEDPAWSPLGDRIAYSSNLFGPFQIMLVKLSDLSTCTAETNFALVSHRRPSWASNGASIYYDAPQQESPENNLAIFKLDFLDANNPCAGNSGKCEIVLDINSHFDVDASRKLVTRTVPNFNFINFTADAQGAFGFGGQHIWRTNYIQNCLPPLPVGVEIEPSTLNLGSGNNITNVGGTPLKTKLTQTPEMAAAGIIAADHNSGAGEGIRVATSGRNRSPSFIGLGVAADPRTGIPVTTNGGGGQNLTIEWSRRRIVLRLISLGLVNELVPVPFEAYTLNSGRRLQGYGYMRLLTSSLAGSVALAQNSPNPFNPETSIRFATGAGGNVALRIYNVRGELVRTLANQWYPQGEHEVRWNGRSDQGSTVASGIYYAKVFGANGATDQIKMVMMK